MRTFLALLVVAASSTALAVPCTDLPVLFIVQDKSGSMNKAPDGSPAGATNPSKWSIAQQVLPSLATQFANRFRFGAEMYPGRTETFNCTVGAVVAPVSYTPAGVQTAYASAVAGGGTPTAVSLQLARTHLESLNLTTPAYVLLLTDGLPNCNLALDASTCPATTPTCVNNSCLLGAKDCLDDTATLVEARALFAAGIKVFVVGFDSALTAGNNLAVLNAIAAAGGTTAAYVATNQAQLTATLNTIASSTATCCRDACTAGAAVCTANGQRQSCQLDAALGCTTWTTAACPPRSACTSGQCVSCTDACTAGALRCNAAGDAEQCVTNAVGCTIWTTAEVCGYGEVCSNGACNSCRPCSPTSSRCTATGVETCELTVSTGCTAWVGRTCPIGTVCQGTNCTACNTACTAGTTRCVGKNVESCVADASGCTQWRTSQTCTTFCSGGACGTCGTSCTAGQSRCNGGGVETCIIDANTCPAWGPVQQCAANTFCVNGTCTPCATTCTQGTRRCTPSSAIEECRLEATGCSAWVSTGQCDVAGGERCDQGVCIPPCRDACTLGATQCMANGQPQLCATAPTGCTLWSNQPECGTNEKCAEGACRALCSADEFEICPPGQICTGLPGGRLCMPEADAGTGAEPSDAGVATGPATVDAGAGTGVDAGLTGIGARAMGCGCNSFDGAGAALPLLGLALVALRRRRT
jgi:uncharacterized protein (TIGR03382 family)